VVSDLNAGTVQYIADERRRAGLDGCFEKFTAEQRERSTRWRGTCGSRMPPRRERI
jgi:hypothetical protein